MKAVVFTLGCKVNECESASIIRGLEEMGYEVSDKIEPADIYIVNTCAVTAEAEKKSRQMIARVNKYADESKIIICGCASQNHPEDFIGKKNVAVVTGAEKKSKILGLLSDEGSFIYDDGLIYDDMPAPERLKTRAFVKVQDGCNNFCSYCIIPYLRGRSRSRNLESAVAEIKGNGALETVIVGIDLSSYDDNGRTLKDLLFALKDEKQRIRLGSLEESVITEEFLSAAAGMKNFMPHFHLSLQSGSDSVLKRMNRHYTRADYLKRCELIYKYFPSAAITTDIIVGFSGETEEEFADSLSIIDEAKFAHVHCFPYSVREGTVAAKKYSDLPSAVKKERLKILSERAAESEKRFLLSNVGGEAEIVREEFTDGFTRGYTANYIRVYVEGDVRDKIIKVKLNGVFRDGMSGSVLP